MAESRNATGWQRHSPPAYLAVVLLLVLIIPTALETAVMINEKEPMVKGGLVRVSPVAEPEQQPNELTTMTPKKLLNMV